MPDKFYPISKNISLSAPLSRPQRVKETVHRALQPQDQMLSPPHLLWGLKLSQGVRLPPILPYTLNIITEKGVAKC